MEPFQKVNPASKDAGKIMDRSKKKKSKKKSAQMDAVKKKMMMYGKK